MQSERKRRPYRLGIYLVVLFVFLAVAVYAAIALSSHGDDGLEWIPFVLLAMPWLRMGQAQEFLFPGLIANAVILYLLGTLLEKVWRSVFRK